MTCICGYTSKFCPECGRPLVKHMPEVTQAPDIMHKNRHSYMSIREINNFAKENNLPKLFKSYSALYSMVRGEKIPVYKAGNRYLIRIVDIENYIAKEAAPIGKIRRID
ncbi:hypothetical protein [Sporomusa sphaeroides]|uniref:Helix-turn-helix domain protein n=1 Tax=Sporomusa sphaeroides DSM 2875 TaxID=1337886 RepID=A0ABM9W1H6_9FIRM|nr:hypothetical protein [Sporomusa sphaeroides]OLS56819.1 hypothetical protein SPSPH_03090 [Sporomusa sphaeroides DSM 2875]CVK18766.1 hypothetical protein SSPH_01410 [Sporomusa sphaeroides DSM 2875]